MLIGQLLRMAEGEIEEARKLRFHRVIMSGADGSRRYAARHFIGGVHTRRAAKGIARKLVQQQQKRQRAFGGGKPAVKFTARRSFVPGDEALAKAAVKFGVLGKPEAGTGFAPETTIAAASAGVCFIAASRVGGMGSLRLNFGRTHAKQSDMNPVI